jgi:oligopeptide transport system substrate-binding protein
VVSAAQRADCGSVVKPAPWCAALTRTLRALAGCAAAMLLCWSPALAAARTLERGNGPEPDSLDPQRAQGLSAHQVLRDLFEGLVRTAADGTVLPAAATTIAVSPDGRAYRFTLRADLRWSDGQPVTAADFAYALQRALDPATAAPYAGVLLPIRGARERLAGAGVAAAIRAEDARTLHIELAAPQADFLHRLTLPVAFPVRAAAIAEHGMAWTRPGRLISNGPYQLVAWTPQSQLVLERNPYYRDSPPIGRVRYHVTEDASQELKRFVAGELHLTETLPPGQLDWLRARFGEQVRIAPAYASFFFGLNVRQPLLQNSAFREALSLAIDREILTRHISGNGEAPAYELVPPQPGQPGGRLAWARLSQGEREELARQRLRASGVDPASALLEIRYNTGLLNRRLALAVAAMWREVLGIHTRLRAEEWRVFVQNRRLGRLTQIYRGGWFADYLHPANFLENFAGSSPLNATGWQDPAFDALLARAAADADAAPALLAEAEQRLLDAHVLIPLYHYTSKHLLSPEVCGYTPHPLDQRPSWTLRWCESQTARGAGDGD